MTARIVRMKKEARALFWLWCAVMIAGALPLFLHQPRYIVLGTNVTELSLMFCFLGILLLATLSLGNEFQHRTLSLLLSQPVSRMEIWGEKLIVTCVAVLSAALVLGYSWRSALQQDPRLLVLAGVSVITTIASATFWTLFARSMLGGFALTFIPPWFVVIVLMNWERILGLNPSPARSITALWTVALGSLCYAGVMLWLGGRKLVRFQVTGGMAGDDLLMAGPSVMPEALAGLFRCRPTGPFLNLIRKELRLLRPLWLITVVAIVYLACMAMFRLLPAFPIPLPRDSQVNYLEWAVFCTLGPLFGVMPILAGILSLGEERTSGTQAWQMTLPVSALRQWLIKLATAMFAGFATSVLLPLLVLIAIGSVFGSPFMFVDFRRLPEWLVMVPVLTFVSFWCACAANGTVRAGTWMLPVTMAIFFAGSAGTWLGQELARTAGTLKDLVVAWFHLSPLAFTTIADFARARVFWLFVPALLLGLIQSYRLFRTQPQDSALWMLRCLMPVATLTILWSFSVSAGFVSSRWEPLSETREALDKLQPGTSKIELAGEDLAKGAPLTALTRRWLRGSRIVIAPDKAHSSGYRATIHLVSGLQYRLTVAHH